MLVLKDILVPIPLIQNPSRFGGTRLNACLRGDLHITATGNHLEVSPPSHTPRMVIPALVETHSHLDKCHSIARMDNVGGDLLQAIARQRQDKAFWTADDLRTRATRGLTEAQNAGCCVIRSHVDWNDEPSPPLAWSVFQELAQDAEISLHCAALTGVALMADAVFCEAVARHVFAAGGALGAFVHGQPEVHAAVKNIFDAATRYALPLDFHVDETLDPLTGLDLIADTAIACQFEGPILCGHAISLMAYSGDALSRLLDKMRRAGITVCALPTTNLYLQGRTDGTPDRRGLTRLREMRAAGVPVVVGSDNVGDAFCPMGQHDPMAALHLASLAAHLDPPIEDWMTMITTDAARSVGKPPCFVDHATLAQLRISAAHNALDLVAGRFALSPIQTSPQ